MNERERQLRELTTETIAKADNLCDEHNAKLSALYAEARQRASEIEREDSAAKLNGSNGTGSNLTQ